jgi:chromosome partitioning protein
MPVISIANPKGGSGKTTLALVLSSTLSHKGARVAALDCDPNQPLKHWRGGASKNALQVISDVGERGLVGVIDREKVRQHFVVIDLEGTASRIVSRAIARSDLVLIPMAASALDAKEAARAISLVGDEEELMGRRIPVRLVFTRTSPLIPTREEKAIIAELTEARVPVLTNRLNQRVAYQAMFSRRLALHELPAQQVNGLAEAITNAENLGAEILATIKSLQQRAA